MRMRDMFDIASPGLPVVGQTPRLEVRDASLWVDGAERLGPLAFTLPQAGCTMVMGPNGAGKSLLLKLLHGLIEPTRGVIRWDGKDPVETRPRQSLVTQKPVLLRRSTLDNLRFVLQARGLDTGRATELLALVGLADKTQTPARRLSGGEQQRLSLARALATDPEVLFLDEPTASLDPASALIIETIITRVRDAGTRVICISHNPAQAERIGTDILFLHHGRIVEQAAAERFFRAPGTPEAAAFLAGEIVV